MDYDTWLERPYREQAEREAVLEELAEIEEGCFVCSECESRDVDHVERRRQLRQHFIDITCGKCGYINEILLEDNRQTEPDDPRI